MASTASLSAPFGAISIFRATGFVARLVADYRTWKARRDTYRELSRLSPEMLDDIGLSRADLEENFLIR